MTITLDEANAKGRRVAQCLQTFGYPVSHAQAMEVVAAVLADQSWEALRLQLGGGLKPENTPQTALHVYPVALYKRQEQGEGSVVARASVLCFSEQQAQEAVFEEFWHPQFDKAGYRPTFRTEVEDFVGIPDVDMLVEWLANIASRPHIGPTSLAELLWGALTNLGAAAVTGDEQYNPAAIHGALQEVARKLPNASALFCGLYAALPEGLYFMAATDGGFMGVDVTLVFAGHIEPSEQDTREA